MTKISILQGEQKAIIDTLGGGLVEYINNDLPIVYGYAESEKSGSQGDVLFPFPGRVEKGRYNFEGQDFELKDLHFTSMGDAIHGFAKDLEWQIIDHEGESLTIECQLLESDFANKGYPFSVKLTLKYQLSDAGLEVLSKIENIDNKPAPIGLGFHPYFTIDGRGVNDLSLALNARKLVEFDENLKPTSNFIDINESSHPFGNSRLIEDYVFDTCFTDLELINDKHTTTISLDEKQINIWQDQNFPYLQIYSSDTLPESNFRKALAVEPMTCCGFAFNKPELGLKILQPGEIFEAKWGILQTNTY